MRIEKQTLSDFNVAKNKKFLITNGLGGYASRTVNNLSSRIYSGLLIASLNPPVERRLLLSDLRERIAIKDETRQRNDNIIHLSDRNKKILKIFMLHHRMKFLCKRVLNLIFIRNIDIM